MHVSRCIWHGIAAGLALSAGPVPAFAAEHRSPPAASAHMLCEDAIAAAEKPATMPGSLLLSIARTESGRLDPATGRVRPWPWTINADGLGSYYPTKEAATAAAAALQARGIQSIDVGCMQVNMRHHPKAFAGLHEAFDPVTNARYAVQFLAALHRQSGDWVQATAAYHSQARERGARYVLRVLGPGAKPLAPVQALPPGDATLPAQRLPFSPALAESRALEGVGRAGLDAGVPGLACPINRC